MQPPLPCAVPGAPSWSRLFPETGHAVSGVFLAYRERHGGPATFGYPLTERFQERNASDGRDYEVQYFERALRRPVARTVIGRGGTAQR